MKIKRLVLLFAFLLIVPLTSHASIAGINVDLKVNGSDGPLTISSADTPLTLSWTSSSETGAPYYCWSGQGFPDWGATFPASGTRVVNPANDMAGHVTGTETGISYELNCSNISTNLGNADSVAISFPISTVPNQVPANQVNINDTSVPIISLFTVTPSVINAGQSATLSVNGTNLATSGINCNLSSDEPRTMAFNFQTAVSPTKTTTYKIVCSYTDGTGASQSAVQTTTLTVNGNSPTPSSTYTSGDPFNDPTYQKVSATPLAYNEKTVTYTYPSNACGTLMTQYVLAGSVYVGNGDVYNLALQYAGQGQTPDTSSFRVYACQNVQFGNSIEGKATFAFKTIPSQSLTNTTTTTNTNTNSNVTLSPVIFTKPVSQMTQAEKQALITQIQGMLAMLIAQLASMQQG